MKILAFDTSSNACSIALQIDNKVRATYQVAPMQQASLILPMIHTLLAEASLAIHALDAIAYGCGPGSFTGIRVANSVAQGLGFAANIPIIPISSLAILAQTAFLEHGFRQLLVAVDARMKQIYWAIYEVDAKGLAQLRKKEQLSAPDKIETPEGTAWQGVGGGWDIYLELLIKTVGFKPLSTLPDLVPNAVALLELAKVKFDEQAWVAPSEAIPVYLR